MIHQLIFAGPKPGLSEEEFQRYWVENHAVEYAKKIPQIRKYLIDTRITGDEEAVFSGVAEIWLDDVESQLASLQTPEFLEGARPDEPKWAAYWQTIALDTDAKEMLAGKGQTLYREESTKLLLLLKRKQNVSLVEFKSHLNTQLHLNDIKQTGAIRYLQCHVRDAAYSLGEPRFDCVLQLWFSDLEAAREAEAALKRAVQSGTGLGSIAEPKHALSMAVKEHWIIKDGEQQEPSPEDQKEEQMPDTESDTRAVAEKWFAAIEAEDGATAATCLDEDVEWINYVRVDGYNDIMPWIGTYHGRDAVMESFDLFLSIAEVKYEKLVRLLVSGEEAAGVVHEISTVKNTGKDFEIEFVQWLTIRNGKIVRWISYTDPSSIIAAMEG